MELDKINTDKNGDLVELKDFKAYNPSKRQMVDKQNHDISKHQKDTVLLCQPESKTNLNSHITDELEKMLKIYEIQKDKGRVYFYFLY